MKTKVIRIDSDTLDMLQIVARELNMSFTSYNAVIKLVLDKYLDVTNNSENSSIDANG